MEGEDDVEQGQEEKEREVHDEEKYDAEEGK